MTTTRRSLLAAGADGHVLGTTNMPGLLTIPIERTAQFKLDDFAGIANMVTDPTAITVHEDSPYRTLQDLVAAARARPETITYASPGVGTDDHLQLVLLQAATSVVTLLLLLFLSVKLQSVFTHPIMSLIRAMREVARTKNYRVALESDRRDEFRDLHEGFNAMLADIRERDEQLSRLATTDALTGLANRRHAMDVLQTMAVRARRKAEPVGVIMLDIDAFKKVNDLHGHPAGDLVLQAVAQVLQASAREYDLVARLGGEEFLVVCDSGTLEVTTAVAERIRAGVEACPVEHDSDTPLHVTVSLGVCAAVPPPAAGGVEKMIRAADKALYRAKEAGRNRYVVAQEEMG